MTNGTETRFGRLAELQKKLDCDWPAITKAAAASKTKLTELKSNLLKGSERPIAEDTSLVFFGSLARREWTAKSDCDWVLLVDGQVNDQHFRSAQTIRRELRKMEEKEPGGTRTFGEIAFSQDIVHRIGGSDDTNRNLTLRMLLLLESVSVGADVARERVIKAVLGRYLADDPSWTWRSDAELPRFLLNDVVRYWRTLAVDFADKFHDQEGEKWALRNTKLRFSRKLIFLTGLLASFSWKLHPPPNLGDRSELAIDVAISHFRNYLSRPPLEIVADELLSWEVPSEVCLSLFSAYNDFLTVLDNEESRSELEVLPRDIAEKSGVFQHIRSRSHAFQGALLQWLFQPKTPIFDLVRKYGLF